MKAMRKAFENGASRAVASVSLVLASFVPFLTMPGAPALAVEARTKRIQIEYVAPGNPEHRELYELLKQRRALEKLQEIFSPFRLPVDLTLRTVGCDGVSNAWYHRPTISVCYEYLDEIYDNVPKETTASGVTPADSIMGQFFYVFAHEMGHAVYDLLRVPLLGPEEDAADYFAAYFMLQFGQDQARRLIIGAAHAYDRHLRTSTVIMPLAAFSNVHSPPAQRFFNLVCLAHGAGAPAGFADLVELGYLPPGRAPHCKFEFHRLSYSVRQLILPHVDGELARQVLDGTWLGEAEMPAPRN
jgi:hypothetical protein